MRIRRLYQGTVLAAMCGCFTALYSGQAMAAYTNLSGPGIEYDNYVVAVEEGNPAIYVSMDSYDVLREANAGEYYQVLGDDGRRGNEADRKKYNDTYKEEPGILYGC